MSIRRAALLGALTASACLLLAAPAQAESASTWWSLTSSAAPTYLSPGAPGQKLVVIATNLGDGPLSGATTPVRILDTLPEPELTAASIEGAAGTGRGGTVGNPGAPGERGPVTCSLTPLRCEFTGTLQPYEHIEVVIALAVSAPPQQPNRVSVSGGGAPSLSIGRPLTVSGEPVPFGVEDYELAPEAAGGQRATQAGSHPFQLTTTLALDQTADPVKPPALPRNLSFKLPPGLLGNPTPFPQCPDVQFLTSPHLTTDLCPDDTAIGVAVVRLDEPVTFKLLTAAVPVFNLKPAVGEPARFGFFVVGVPVVLDTAVRTGGDYGVTVSSYNTSQTANFISSIVTLWGVPGAAAHNPSRGWSCVAGGFFSAGGSPCESTPEVQAPFLVMPTSCADPLSAPITSTVQADSWPAPYRQSQTATPFTYTLQDSLGRPFGMDGCNRLPFEPSLEVAPDLEEASSPSGLSVGLHLPQEPALNPAGLAVSALRDTTVALPEGVTLDPSGADGLGTCSEAQIGFTGTEPGSGRDLFTPTYPSCPNAAKVGTMRVDTPLLPNPLEGSVYLATPHQNPFGSLLALYLVAEDPVSGVALKLAGEVSPDPRSGRLLTSFHNTPDVPFEDLKLHFFGGDRAPLVTPPACGPYTTTGLFSPWSGNAATEALSTFQISSGTNGGPCPSGGLPPFAPNLLAGTTNNAAAHYSPLDLELTRGDAEQEITHFSLKLPPGLSGKLAGIPFCSDAAIAQAKAREREGGGAAEEAGPSCPASSEVGRTLVGAGVGSLLVWVPGKVYLAGPYHGSAISVVAITNAKVGPFDLGTVVVREALRVNPETAEVFVDATGSDPIPHIVDGVPTHLRNVRIYMDRPEFILNPTSCERMSIASTVLGSGLDFASEADDVPVTVSSPFQAADCASLPFKPNLKLRLRGGAKRGAHPAFRAELTMRPGEANIGRAQVTLPRSEFLDNAHIGTVCTRAQFNQGAVPGQKCPPASIYGHARAITPILSEPLEGPVYLRSSEHKLPDLLAALHSGEIEIALDGRIDSVKGQIRNTFETVPDAPVSKFVLEMAGGDKGLLVNSTNICTVHAHAVADFTAHNGKTRDFNPALEAKCGKGGKGKPHKRRGRRGSPRHRRAVG